jgi:CheY-like chemotaxis protein
VLVVDDEKNIRLTLRQVLEEEGLHVETASDGAEALEKVRAASFDLVLMDLRMPGLGGLETMPQLREQHPNLPVVVFTAHGNAENATEAMKLGATDFAEKPFSPTQIRALVRGLGAAPPADAATQADEPSSPQKKKPARHVHRTLVFVNDPASARALLALGAASAHSYARGEVVVAGFADAPDAERPRLEALAARVREEHAVTARPRAVDGDDLREALSAAAQAEAFDHILLAWNGAPAEARALDDLAQQIAQAAGCEVTLVRPGPRVLAQPSGPHHRIAAVVSRAPHALVAVRRALEWSKSAGVASLTLLRAQTVPPEGDEGRLNRDGRALIEQVAHRAGLSENQYRTHQTVSTDDRALVRSAEDFDTLCVSAAHADELIPALFGDGEGSGRITGTVALVRGPAHQEPSVLESLVQRLTGAA